MDVTEGRNRISYLSGFSLLGLLLALICGCSSGKSPQLPFTRSDESLFADPGDSDDYLTPYRNLRYIGAFADTLDLQNQIEFQARWPEGGLSKQEKESLYLQNLSLEFDRTNQLDERLVVYYMEDSLPPDTIPRKAFPVFLRNNGTSAALIGEANELKLSLEYRDSLGKWKNLSFSKGWICGTGRRFYLLHPREIAVITLPVFTEGKERLLRILYTYGRKKLYSKEFRGRVPVKKLEEAPYRHWLERQ